MDVRVRSVTGSGGTGRLITEAAAKSNLKNVYLEKSLATIFDDADLDAAAKETQHSIAWNSGQVCMANSRIYVQNTVAEKFITMFKDNCANVKIGVFTDPGVQMCPLADESQFQSVNKYIELGKSEAGCSFMAI
ncbi:Aldehyde dehydrogenase [Lasiodiplodia theobromae]|uniref:aldehyde dehydrogenase (NAD(+)) n=1 Tax=Lasiodiplodia theobromae TaxID=45133 RepID=A0A5N5CV64_9PEZI|nr:Aldehyde dehydrogenase [Lasiodiplodia theobromae]